MCKIYEQLENVLLNEMFVMHQQEIHTHRAIYEDWEQKMISEVTVLCL